MQNGHDNIIDLSTLRDAPKDAGGGQVQVKQQVPIAACAVTSTGEFTVMRTDAMGYVFISPENIESIALRVVELLRPPKNA